MGKDNADKSSFGACYNVHILTFLRFELLSECHKAKDHYRKY